MTAYEETMKDIEKTLGIVPGFIKDIPPDVFPDTIFSLGYSSNIGVWGCNPSATMTKIRMNNLQNSSTKRFNSTFFAPLRCSTKFSRR